VVKQAEDAQQSGFARATRPHDGDEVTLGNLEVDLAENAGETGFGPVAFLDIPELDHRMVRCSGGGLFRRKEIIHGSMPAGVTA